MYETNNTLYYIILASFVMPILLSIILIWFFLAYQKKKHQAESERKDAMLREQSHIISQQKALQEERSRIAEEMHDDLGGGLTKIKFLSQGVLRKIPEESEKLKVQKITEQAQTLVNNMSEIIWAMNAGFDTLDNLISYSRRFAKEYLDTYGINLIFEIKGPIDERELAGEKRRNLFLIIKEILHNVVKHAAATEVSMIFKLEDQLTISISDNGKGIDEANRTEGNGLNNIDKRIKKLNGKVSRVNNGGLNYLIEIDSKAL